MTFTKELDEIMRLLYKKVVAAWIENQKMKMPLLLGDVLEAIDSIMGEGFCYRLEEEEEEEEEDE